MRTKDSRWFDRIVYNPKGLPGVRTADPRVDGGVTNGIKTDTRGFCRCVWVMFSSIWRMWVQSGHMV